MRLWAIAGIAGISITLLVTPMALAQRPAKSRASVKPAGPTPPETTGLEQYGKLNAEIMTLQYQIQRLQQQFGENDSHQRKEP